MVRKQSEFNISDILKKMFKEHEPIGETTPFIYDDKNLYVDYKITIPYSRTSSYLTWIEDGDNSSSNSNSITNIFKGDNSYIVSGKALHAVAQLGESIDYTKQRGTYRTNFDKLIVYEGYPASLSFIGFKGNTEITYKPHSNTRVVSQNDFFTVNLKYVEDYISIKQESLDKKLQADNKKWELEYVKGLKAGKEEFIELVPSPELGTSIKMVEKRCIPTNPFYIRWINQLGGWDYWMFSFRQTIESKVKGIKTFEPTVFDIENATKLSEEYYKEAEQSITVGAEGLNSNEFDSISKLIYSPRIEFYQKETGRWFKLIPDKVETENDTRSTAKEIELTFLLPTPQLQI